MGRGPKDHGTRKDIDQQIDQVSGEGRNRAEDDKLSWRGGRGHEHFERSRLLRLLHRAQECLGAHHKESVEAGPYKKKREVLDATGSEAGANGTGEEIKCCQFGKYSHQLHDEPAAMPNGREQVTLQDGAELVESGSHGSRICNFQFVFVISSPGIVNDKFQNAIQITNAGYKPLELEQGLIDLTRHSEVKRPQRFSAFTFAHVAIGE